MHELWNVDEFSKFSYPIVVSKTLRFFEFHSSLCVCVFMISWLEGEKHQSREYHFLRKKDLSIRCLLYKIIGRFVWKQQDSAFLASTFVISIFKPHSFHVSFSFSFFFSSKDWSNKPTKMHFLPEEYEQMSKKQALKL